MKIDDKLAKAIKIVIKTLYKAKILSLILFIINLFIFPPKLI